MKCIQSVAVALLMMSAVTGWTQSFRPTYSLTKVPGTAVDAGNVLVYGRVPGSGIGTTVRSGDLNGDGIDDLIVGAHSDDVGSPVRNSSGAVHIWFGKSTLAGLKDVAGLLGTPPDLMILGASASDQVSFGGAVLADVNGDGTVDLILGAHFAAGPLDSRAQCGEAYVVFGRKSPATFPAVLDLALQGTNGADVTIYGANFNDHLTSNGALFDNSITTGDLNGDGVADIILGAAGGDGPANGRAEAGEAYIIFGRQSPAAFPSTIDLTNALGGADVTIYGATAGDNLTDGGNLAIGDFNGDGVADLLLGAHNADGPNDTRGSCGEAYIVFGRSSPSAFPSIVDLAMDAGVTIYGRSAGDRLTQYGAMTVGDVDGDGIVDIILGASLADGPGNARLDSGEAYVIFGRKTPNFFPPTLDMAVSGNDGANVTIFGASAGDSLTVTGALKTGDVNGDGVTDIVLGAAFADGTTGGPGDNRGEAYVVFGRKLPTTFPVSLDLAVPGNTGANLTIYGFASGFALTSADGVACQDITGDGAAEIILVDSAKVYVVLGKKTPANFPATLTLSTSGSAGNFVTLSGGQGFGLAGAFGFGDLNGDGTRDLLIGAVSASAGLRGTGTGEAYVLYGIAATGPKLVGTAETNNITLTWPDGFSSYALQSATDLTLSNWTGIVTSTNRVVWPRTNAAQFFRLVSP